MRKLLALLGITFLAVFFIQCNKSAKKETDLQLDTIDSGVVHITGLIHNKDRYPNTKELLIEIPDVSGKAFRLLTPIEENGTFHFRFKLNQAQDIRMEPYLDFLYVKPNDSLHIELDFNDLQKVQLSGGEAVKINNELQRYFDQTFYRGDEYYIGTVNEHNLSFEEIRRLLDDKRRLNHEKRSDFLQTTPINDDVSFLTESMIELDYYSHLIRILYFKSHLDKEANSPITLRNEIDEKAILYFSKELYSDSHFHFIEAYMMLNSLISPTPPHEDSLLVHQSHFPNDTFRSFAFARQASIALKTKNLDIFERIYSQIDHRYLNSRLMKEYEVTWEKMNNPEAVSAAITGSKSDMQQNTSFKENMISEIISRNKGKIQVIDIWSTWCPPCVAELPHYRSLMDDYTDKGVVFSFICVGKDEQQSYKLLQDHQLSNAYSHYCTAEELSFLSKTFSPMNLPYGILVNKKGVIVDHGSHVRASLIRNKIDVLLEHDKLISVK